MKLFVPSMFFSGIILLATEDISLSTAYAQTTQAVSSQINLATTGTHQAIIIKSDFSFNSNRNHSQPHPILHAIARLFGFNSSSSSSGSSYRQSTYSNFSSRTSSSFNSSYSHPSGISGFFHGIASAIGNGINKVTNFITGGIKSVASSFQRVFTGITALTKTGIDLYHRAISDVILGKNYAPAPLVPSAEVMANAAGKVPVILVHGGFSNSNDMKLYYNAFEKAGIPSYAPTLGNGPSNLLSFLDPSIGGTGPIDHSARQLSNFIDQVQRQTGAPKVDLVGVSQGGLIMRDYLVHNNKDNIEAVATMGGATHGTNMSGLVNALGKIPRFLSNTVKGAFSFFEGPANIDLMDNSRLVRALNRYPDTKPGINYLNIASNTDNAITPWQQASFLKAGPGASVTNIETHTIPGVPADFTHGQYGKIQAIVDTAVRYIQTHGQSGPGIPSKGSSPVTPAQTQRPFYSAPTVSLLG